MSPFLIPKHTSQPPPRPGPQGEEYEALKAKQAALSASDRFAQELLEPAGFLAYPFVHAPHS